MRAAQKNMSIRLAVVDGKRVEETFERVGRTGEQAMGRISRSTAPANAGLIGRGDDRRRTNGLAAQIAFD